MAALSEETRARILAMYRSGAKTAKITAEAGVPRSTIYFVLRQAGVTPDRRPRGESGSTQRSAPPEGTELPANSTETLTWALRRLEDLERENASLRARLEIIADAIDQARRL